MRWLIAFIRRVIDMIRRRFFMSPSGGDDNFYLIKDGVAVNGEIKPFNMGGTNTLEYDAVNKSLFASVQSNYGAPIEFFVDSQYDLTQYTTAYIDCDYSNNGASSAAAYQYFLYRQYIRSGSGVSGYVNQQDIYNKVIESRPRQVVPITIAGATASQVVGFILSCGAAETKVNIYNVWLE